jgi:hypothetical protein
MFIVDDRGVAPSMTDRARTNARPRTPPAGTAGSVSAPVPVQEVTFTPVMLIFPYCAVSAATSVSSPVGRLCRRSSFTSPAASRVSVAPFCSTRSALSSQTPGATCASGAPGQAALISVSVSTAVPDVR